ncbi:MAG TPA: hypothetical protein VFF70_06720, partial [Anaerolineae bacterium]|nr:hypothetical protein [Anaerolineae bacterium]
AGLLDEYGVDVGRMQLYPPTASYDYMGYAGSEDNSWTSVYTYRAMAGAIRSVSEAGSKTHLAMPANPQLAATAEFLVASGSIGHSTLDIQQGFYRTTLLARTTDHLPFGPYSIELQTANGHVLLSREFGPLELSNEEPTDEGLFQMMVPSIKGTTTIVFKYNGVEIGRRAASAHAPSVQVTAPNGGETWSAAGNQTIRWTASDADKDTLTFSVLYSPDKGNTWHTLIANTHELQLTLDSASVHGGDAAFIRVMATDGFNTVEDLSDAAFTVAAKGPDVYIGSPVDGQHILEGFPVVLQAYGTDLEDGPLPSTAFSWSSDKDGPLGNGDQLLADHLSVGEHTITLTGKDSAGNAGTYSVKITIDAKPPLAPNSPIDEQSTPAPAATAQPSAPTATVAPTTGGNTSVAVIGLMLVALGLVLLVVIVALLRRK